MLVRSLNPLERGYQVGDKDVIFMKSRLGNEMVNAEVVSLDGQKPIFKVISPKDHFGETLRVWDVVFM